MSTHSKWFEEERDEASRKNFDGTDRTAGSIEIHAHVFSIGSNESPSDVGSKLHQIISQVISGNATEMDRAGMLMNACINLEAIILRAGDPNLSQEDAFQQAGQVVQGKTAPGTMKEIMMQSATIFAQCAMKLKRLAENTPDE